MNFFYVLITAMTVSIDSFFCGLSLSACKTDKLKITLGISSVVFLMCLIANYFGKYVSFLLGKYTETVGGITLILISVYNFICSLKADAKQGVKLKTVIYTGIAIGTDGACANFSLAVMGYANILLPLLFTFFHLLFLNFAILVSKIKIFKNLEEKQIFAPLILFCLGLYKVIKTLF